MRIVGILLILLGAAHSVWAWYIVANSLHLGSPLRRTSQALRDLSDESAAKVDAMLDVGRLGFKLLEGSLFLSLATAAALFALGGLLVWHSWRETEVGAT